MKAIIIIGDGMADKPLERLVGKTPLMVANKPNIDKIARLGRTGRFDSIPKGWPKGSDVANLGVLGYDPKETFQGRAVIEAASMGVELGPGDVALRCNLIALDEGHIKNHSAGHIENEDAERIMATLKEELEDDDEHPVTFHQGVSYRHLMVLRGGWASPEVECAPPHDHVGEKVIDLLPKPKDDSEKAQTTADHLINLYQRAWAILSEHPVNAKRSEQDLDCADAIWPWSPGVKPQMKTFQERFGVHGAVISAVDLVKGLGVLAGMDVIDVPGATGLWDTNYEGKAEAALKALEDHDLVYVHVEATDEAGHSKDLDLKVKCIEMLDERIVGPILEGVEKRGDTIISVLPDHPTPVESGAHDDAPVPVAIWHPHIAADDTDRYDEEAVNNGSYGLLKGEAFIKKALGLES